MKSLSRSIALAVAALSVAAGFASVPLSYYQSLDGLSGSELKTAVHRLVTAGVTVLPYGSGASRTWGGFYVTDRAADNSVIDRYSNEKFYFGNRGNSVSGMNIEHSFPKSWWGGDENNAYCDLFNLMPCEANINMSKSNYPMGTVTQQADLTDNGCTRVGRGSDGSMYWEPADKWKGDFARGYMYMATAYQDYTWVNSRASAILETGSYPTLKSNASQLYIRWALADDVDNIEITRNEAVQGIQGNRNPFIDFPNLMRYIWGDSIGVPFHPATTRHAGQGGASGPYTVYESTFLGVTGDCTISTTSNPDNLSSIWTNSSSYGWVGSGATGSGSSLRCHVTSSDLITPALDLTNCDSATLNFYHACNFAASPQARLSVCVVKADGSMEQAEVPTWPSGANWTFVASGDVDLSRWCGSAVRVAFRYTSTDSEAPKWEIKNVTVTGYPHQVAPGDDPALQGDRVLYESTFTADDGECRIIAETKPDDLRYVWSNSATYGWVAKGSWTVNGNLEMYNTDSYLATPSFVISSGHKATLTFQHACKFAAKPSAVLQVVVVDERGVYHPLEVASWPTGTNWTYVNSGEVDLSAFAGQKVSIAFHYTSTTDEASQWEIKNVKVTQEGTPSQPDDPVTPPDKPVTLGDVNSDGEINITDVVLVVNVIMDQAPADFNFKAADTNSDGEINVTDVVNIVNVILAVK